MYHVLLKRIDYLFVICLFILFYLLMFDFFNKMIIILKLVIYSMNSSNTYHIYYIFGSIH